jgi:hypothetical protein
MSRFSHPEEVADVWLKHDGGYSQVPDDIPIWKGAERVEQPPPEVLAPADQAPAFSPEDLARLRAAIDEGRI